MDRRKQKRLILVNRLLSGALTLLGFTACSSTESPDEYGCPYAEYELKGKVTDSEKRPIEGARMIVRNLRPTEEEAWTSYSSDTVYTQADGTFNYQRSGERADRLRLVCQDPSEACKADSTEMDVELTGGKGWFLGNFSKEINFELEKEGEQ